ncbi:helix-turn-helix domain-containing protein [Allosalinactinospora lopnorensis]|uniref:helix-turn-helix domain-containing protein n=1 Tax=Allosalinactinospora lopnorensis TaxID=1352348 RepID=UPI000623CEDD|nr:helix-turn-helix transcriptional regulator [Allosalinactinospora lopnorensis]
MSRTPGPMWHRFGAEVRKRRSGTGLSQAQLAGRIALSASMLSYIETGAKTPRFEHAQALDAVLDTGGAFERLWHQCNNQGAFPVGFSQFLDLERTALELHEFHNALVPGLAQTPEYARAVFVSTRPWDNEESIERLVEGRVKRQALLDQGDRPLIWMVLDEEVIRRVIGDVNIAKAQLDHLLTLVEQRKLRLQVVPRDVRFHPGLSGPFRVYVFQDRPTIASAEYVVDDQIIDDADQVRQCATIFGALQAEALSPQKSADLIKEVQGELDG